MGVSGFGTYAKNIRQTFELRGGNYRTSTQTSYSADNITYESARMLDLSKYGDVIGVYLVAALNSSPAQTAYCALYYDEVFGTARSLVTNGTIAGTVETTVSNGAVTGKVVVSSNLVDALPKGSCCVYLAVKTSAGGTTSLWNGYLIIDSVIR